MHQCHALELFENMSELYRIRFEEITPCRYIVKQVPHLKIGSFGTDDVFLAFHPGSFDEYAGS
jgi:hypothetical protein